MRQKHLNTNILLSILVLSFIYFSGNAQQKTDNTACTSKDLGTFTLLDSCSLTTQTTYTFSGSTIGVSKDTMGYGMYLCNGTKRYQQCSWVKFKASGQGMIVHIKGNGSNPLLKPGIILYQYQNFCNIHTPMDCNSDSLRFEGLMPGATYILQLYSQDATDPEGDYIGDILNYPTCQSCLRKASITLDPPPVAGRYGTNASVTICVTIDQYKEHSGNRLHGVVPELGAGWNTATLAPVSAPAFLNAEGTWKWYTAAQSPNGNAGFFYNIKANAADSLASNNEGDKYANGRPWKFCVAATTTLTCTQGKDASVKFKTYSDAQTGNRTGNSYCAADAKVVAATSIVCCATASVTATNASCFGKCDAAIYLHNFTSTSYAQLQKQGAVSAGAVTGVSTFTFNNQCEGTYVVSHYTSPVASNCTKVKAVTIKGPFDFSIVQSDPSCNTNCNRTAKVVLNTTTTGFTYAWSNGSAKDSANNLCPGQTYTVTVKLSSCSLVKTVTIYPAYAPNASVTYPKSSICVSDTTSYYPTVMASGGIFSISPNTVAIDSITGKIKLNGTESPQLYTITHTLKKYCSTSKTFLLNITPNNPCTITYSSTKYCAIDTSLINPPTVSTPGGTFSILPAILTINSIDGKIKLNGTAPPGTYTVTYNTNLVCFDKAYAFITILPMKNGSFNYSPNQFCQADLGTPHTPVISGDTGIFSISPTLNINPQNGTITLNGTETPGNYKVKNTLSAACSSSDSTTIQIVPKQTGPFQYHPSIFCKNDTSNAHFPTVNGTSGVFSVIPSSINIDPVSGKIKLTGLESSGTYKVFNTINGICVSVDSSTINIADTVNTDFYYPTTNFCLKDSGLAHVPVIPADTGIFSVYPNTISIDSTNGTIVLMGNETPGNYKIMHKIYGACGSADSTIITVIKKYVPRIYYHPARFCSKDTGIVHQPVIIGDTGVFSISPSVPLFDSLNGKITTTGTEVLGIYRIINTLTGACTTNDTTHILFTDKFDASLQYVTPYLCLSNAGIPFDPILQAEPDSFSINPFIPGFDPTSGQIILSGTETPGNYTITHNIGGACSDTDSVAIAIIKKYDPSFHYTTSPFCLNDTGIVHSPVIGSDTGIFKIFPTGIIDLDSTNGKIILSGVEVPGSYKVLNTLTGPCTFNDSSIIQVVAPPNASFNYPVSVFCLKDAGSMYSPVLGSDTGTFAVQPSGLTLDTTNGKVTIAGTENPGTYTIYQKFSGFCGTIDSTKITIIKKYNPFFQYQPSSFCLLDTGIVHTPVIGADTGVFSVFPTGLSLDSTNGELVLHGGETPGNYKIFHTLTGVCTINDSANIQVIAPPDAAFHYAISTFCLKDAGTAYTPILGADTGTFSVQPSGLNLNSVNGKIILTGVENPGTYTVYHDFPGFCGAIDSTKITIIKKYNPSFQYQPSSYCLLDTGIVHRPIISGDTGKFFVFPTSLSIDSTNGKFVLNGGENPGNYKIIHTFTGVCTQNDSTYITLHAPINAAFHYQPSQFCLANTGAIYTPMLGNDTGIFSISPIGININSVNGKISIAGTESPGSYKVFQKFPGGCNSFDSTTITIIKKFDPTIQYQPSQFCLNDIGTPHIPTIGADTGFFSISPAGVNIDSATGKIILNGTENTGTYKVFNTLSGMCSHNDSTNVTIISPPSAAFYYQPSLFCLKDAGSIYSPIISGGNAGKFSSSPTGLSVNTSNGTITLTGTEAPGTYTIFNTVSAMCTSTDSTVVTLQQKYNLAFLYQPFQFCIKDTGVAHLPIVQGLKGIFSIYPNTLKLDSMNGKLSLTGKESPGKYTVFNSMKGTCADIDSSHIFIQNNFDATFTYNASVFCIRNEIVTPNYIATSGGRFKASPYGLSIDSITGNIDLGNSLSNNYEVIYTTPSGICQGSSKFTISISEPCPIVIYNGFTPNFDGKNDVWYIEGIEHYSNNEVQVFNRWGNRIWYGANYDNKKVVWDGFTENGASLPEATYFYIIKAGENTYKGWVELSR